jgi:cobalt/nickel transport system permease protein
VRASTIDFYSYHGRWREKSPMVKFGLTLWLLVLALMSTSSVDHAAMLVALSIMIVLGNRTPLKVYMKLLTIPLIFLFLSVLGIIVPVDVFQKGIGWDAVHRATRVMSKAMASVTCLYLLVLTTPLGDILEVLKKLKMSPVLIELMYLSYRMIWLLASISEKMYSGQVIRLGYRRMGIGFKSLGSLGTMLFKRSYKRADAMYTAMTLRGYSGSFHHLVAPYTHFKEDLVEAILIGSVCFILVLVL